MGIRKVPKFVTHPESVKINVRADSLALIIQGPLHYKTVEQIECNTKYFNKIVVSTWHVSNEQELEIWSHLKEITKYHHGLKLITQKLPINPKSNLPTKFHLQLLSIYAALDSIYEEKIIKTRSDEFMDLGKFKKFVENSSYLFQFGNFIVRDWNYHSFHISDHLFAAPRLNLKSSIEWLLSANEEQLIDLLGKDSTCPESLLGISLLKSDITSFNNSQTRKTAFQMFKERFELFDLEDLDSFQVCANSAGTGYLSQINRVHIEIANLINWNHFTSVEQMKPSMIKSFIRRKIQPRVRQILINKFKRPMGAR